MNKIKLLYDVVRTMRAKERVNGVLTANVSKDQEEILSLRNEFAKNAAGEAKAEVCCELSLDGSKVKRESRTEFSAAEGGRRGFLGLFIRHHHHQVKDGCPGFQGILSRISNLFGILNSLKAEEKENGAAVLSLDLSEVPEEMKFLLQERLRQRHDRRPHCGILEQCELETLNGVLELTVNSGRELERLEATLHGRVRHAQSGLHTMAARADLQLVW